ncbi:restriction endonuclease [Chryseobacterium chendengshani]|uniref:restriction endonuclease n=1 Tax=Chryseobacterium sp. LJ668 TaxID=2864040 RepID=UPI001C68B499|nr:restriction endonuclease [Chryseobacterium sp. LJ668]MBW8524514.1 restriction endonuclease [Chryseobacterium sp. LJ668]QYK15244.1 restriction endonuclease [Chryseobacterium sp. LJ668]
MSPFEYNYFGSPLRSGDDNPHSTTCIFCKNELEVYSLHDYWDVDLKEIYTFHQLDKKLWNDELGIDKDMWELDLSRYCCEVYFNHCNKCGWWRILKDVTVWAKEWQLWQFFYGTVGRLKKLDLHNVKAPITEISKYLLAKYKKRFDLHPKLLEDVTGMVFKNLGYEVVVTGYSNDGGIDVILEKNNNQIGVQVKRHKNKIKVNQIRELTGALFISGIPKGIFVTTSDFQRGAKKVVQTLAGKGMPIELINAKRFYDILKLTTQSQIDRENIRDKLNKVLNTKLHSYKWENPMNSL